MRISGWSSDLCSSDLVGEGDGINVDLSFADDVDRFFEAAKACLGAIDIAVINAAIPASALADRSEEHTSELQSLMRISYAVFCLKKKTEESTKIKPGTTE